MATLKAFWKWATSRPGVVIVLAIIVATVVIVAMVLNQDADLYDAVIELFKIMFKTAGVG